MILVLLAAVCLGAAAACFFVVVRHAFLRSTGTGFMVLLIPLVSILYGFNQFEHRQKGLILAGWLGGFFVGVVLRTVAVVQAGA